MKKHMIGMMALMLMASPAMAAEDSCDGAINVKVNGLVCDFCARALEKVFGEREEVENIKVDLGNSLVTIHTKAGAELDDATVEELIGDSGYNIDTIEHGC